RALRTGSRKIGAIMQPLSAPDVAGGIPDPLFDHLRIMSMLKPEHVGGNVFPGIRGSHRRLSLKHDAPLIILLVYFVYGDAGNGHTGGFHGAMDVVAVHAFATKPGE